jgi:hypothetical protein
MEGPSADQSRQDRPQTRTSHGLLTLVAMVLITGGSIVWGLATLECPTGKDQWGACKPQDPALRNETTEFIWRLLIPQ